MTFALRQTSKARGTPQPHLRVGGNYLAEAELARGRSAPFGQGAEADA